MSFRGVNRFDWIPAAAGTTGDMSIICYYDVLVDSGLIGKFDSYLSFLRRQESRREKFIGNLVVILIRICRSPRILGES